VSFPVVNDGAAPLVAATWRDAVWLSSDDVLGGDDLRLGSQNRSTSFDGDGDLVIDPYTGLVTGTLPTSLAPGTYRTIVVLDENGTLFEAGGEDNNQRVSSPFTVESRPTDLTLELTDTPSTGAIGEPLDVAWSVTNDGVEVTPVAAWSDAIYLSADEQLGAGDLVLVQRPHSGALSPGESYDGSATIEVPDVEPGTYFLIAAADSTDAVYEEAGEDNNTSVTAFEVTPADEDFLPDLQVTSIIAPSTVDEGASFELSWTVTNAGGEDITGGVWFDEVFLSQNQTIDTGDVPLVQATRFGPLAAGDSYTEVRPVTLPTGITGSRFIIVRTDGSNRVFEADDDNNVSTRPQTIQGPPPPTANLVTDVVTAPATAKAGLAIDVDWMVSNVGEEDAPGGWTDSILLSSDPEVDGGDRLLGTLVQSEALAAGESRSSSTSVVLPLDVSGPLFVIVVSDAGNDVDEGDFEGDNALASTTPVIIEIGDLANLIVTSVVAPSSATSGQSITIDWTVANVGEGATDVPAWSEVVYLSRDQIFSPSTDVFLGSFAETMALDAGSTRNRTATFELPFGLAETYYVFVATDRLDDVLELNDLDNIGQSDSTVDVILPDPADLIVSSVAGDLVAQLGENAEFTWEITNQGDTPVFGSWTDAVYLSTDGLWSIDDVRVGQASAPSGELGPGESVQLTLDASIPPVVPGTYQVIVRSDVFNQIPETDEQNNEGVAAIPTTITAIPLELDSPVIRPLPNGDEAYFALTVPAGETIEVTLEHDSLEAWTELYGRYESVPTTGQFDFRFDVPGQSTQSITIPFSEAGTYYLYARTITGAFEPDGTDATILARAIPFGIESASPPRIGQARRVTVRIEGSRFREGAAASLVGPGGTIGALRTLIVDGDTIDAGFELLDASLGTYDVLVTDPDGPVAILKNAVEIEPASPITTTVEVAGPSSMRVNSAANFTVRVRNLSNQDIDHGTLIFDMVAVEGDRIFINQLADVTVSGDPRDLTGADLSVVRNGRRSAPVHFTGLRAGGVADVTFTVVLGPGGGNEPLETGAVFSPLTSETFVDFVLETAESYRQDVLADLASYPEDFQADLLAAATDQAGWTSIWIQSQVELGVLDPFYDGEIAGQMIDGIVNDVANGIAIAATIGVGIATIVGAAPVVIGGGTIVAGVAAGIGYFWPDDPPCQCCGGGGGGGGGGGALVLQMPSGDDGDSCGERGCDRRRPIDPNEKTGPFGFDEGFIAAGTDIPYTVFFENVPEATANAAVVTIDDPLDSSLNLGTFRLGNIGFADYLVEVPADTSFFQTTLDLTDDPDRGVLLEITGGVDAATGDAFWVFTSIDPETGGIPSSPDEGFLPPNGEDGEGEGFVSFTIRPKASAVTGTVIENEAAIVFDDQEPIVTNTIVLTLDADAPSSTVAGLPAITDQSQITLTWSGQDVSGGSGLTSFSIFASENGGPFLPLIEDTLEQTAVFMGEPGSTYAFYSVATDQAGNVETEPLEPDTEITFGLFALDPASDSGTVGDGLTNDATPTFLIASAPSSALVLDLVGSGYAESIPLMTDESGMVSYTVPEAIALPDGPIAAMVTAFGVTFDLALVIDTESPSVTGWAAAAEHGDLGEAVVGLPGLALASESRVGGLSTVLVTFDADAAEAAGLAPSSVSIEAIDESGAPIDLGGTSVAIAQRPGTPTYEIGFDPPLATVGLYCLVLEGVADAAGNPMTARASTVRTIVVLGGDAVGDAVVDGLDLALVDGLLGTDPIDLGDPMQVRADIDRDGAIDLDDRSLVEAALGTDLSALTRPCPAPGDVNGDGMVDVMDLLAMLAQWGECPPPPADCPADVNGDGVVDSADLLILISAWGDAGLGGAVPVRVAGPSVNDAISSEIVAPSIEILEIEGGPTRIRLVGGEVDGSAPAALPVRLRRWDVALERVLDLLLGGGGGDPAEVFTALDELGFAMSMDELVQDAARVVDGEETVFVDPVTPMVVAGDLVQTADGDLTVVLTGAAGSIPVIRVDGLAVLDGRLRVELVGGLARLDEPVVILVAERIRGRFRDVEIVGADEDTAIRIEYVEDDGPAAARGR